ncbi:hypothetical protein MNBD_BACTEROID07-689 [hydrothermal vent metagenome]|uniref:Uncharacterized protein n=1 Tax=hydrothermal vent metagenome TaxID=652676 RepID=A0A3B0UBE1_9ZZZZ
MHRMTYYKNKYQLKASDFPNTERTWRGNVSLPIFPYMQEKELSYICETIGKIFIG